MIVIEKIVNSSLFSDELICPRSTVLKVFSAFKFDTNWAIESSEPDTPLSCTCVSATEIELNEISVGILSATFVITSDLFYLSRAPGRLLSFLQISKRNFKIF